MRLWSLHPSLLDSKGLVALWREGLLAKKVLQNKTKGYKNHPQLIRFKKCTNSVGAINLYLAIVYQEAKNRNYNFNRNKIDWTFKSHSIMVTKGQLNYELKHLKKKVAARSPDHKIFYLKDKMHHPIFRVVQGKVESWEIVKRQ